MFNVTDLYHAGLRTSHGDPPASAQQSRTAGGGINKGPIITGLVLVVLVVLFFVLSTCASFWESRFRRRRQAEAELMDSSHRKRVIKSHLRVRPWGSSGSNNLTCDSKTASKEVLPSAMTEHSEPNSVDLESNTPSETDEAGFTCGESGEGAGCAICLDHFHSGDTVCESTQCSHRFHVECMTDWLKKHHDCPVCRQPYLKEEES